MMYLPANAQPKQGSGRFTAILRKTLINQNKPSKSYPTCIAFLSNRMATIAGFLLPIKITRCLSPWGSFSVDGSQRVISH